MKVYLEDSTTPTPKESQPTTRRSSRSGGFKPTKPGRETYDGQGFGGAGRRGAKKASEDEEPRGVDVGVSEEEETEGFDTPEEATEDGAVESAEDAEENEGYEEEELPRGKKGPAKRRRMSVEEQTEEEFEAYQASKNRRGPKGKKAPKPKKEPKSKKEKGQPITLNKNAGTAGKKNGPKKRAPEPEQPKKGMSLNVGGGSAGKPPKAAKPPKQPKVAVSAQEPEDDFDVAFNDMPPKESIVSQIITIVEVAVGAGLSYFGASQLGYILIQKIMTGG